MKAISTKVGIYDAEYRLIKHRGGGVSIKTPYVKWVNNSGSLAFKNVKLTKFVDQALACFADEESEMTISEIVYENED